jgi:hypothetical protein
MSIGTALIGVIAPHLTPVPEVPPRLMLNKFNTIRRGLE